MCILAPSARPIILSCSMLVLFNNTDKPEVCTMELLDTLVEMGFSRARAVVALNMTCNVGVEPALEWILSHPEPEEEAPVSVGAARKPSESDGEWDEASDTPVTDGPREIHVELMCGECKLVFTNDLDIEKHTAKFGHYGYVEPPKCDNGEIASKACEVNGLTSETDISIYEEYPKKESSPEVTGDAFVRPKRSKTDLQIQLPNGDVLHQTFGINEELSYVRLFIQLNRTDGEGEFVLTTIFNGRTFADEDYSKPLHALGLVPNAHIFVKELVPDKSALV